MPTIVPEGESDHLSGAFATRRRFRESTNPVAVLEPQRADQPTIFEPQRGDQSIARGGSPWDLVTPTKRPSPNGAPARRASRKTARNAAARFTATSSVAPLGLARGRRETMGFATVPGVSTPGYEQWPRWGRAPQVSPRPDLHVGLSRTGTLPRRLLPYDSAPSAVSSGVSSTGVSSTGVSSAGFNCSRNCCARSLLP